MDSMKRAVLGMAFAAAACSSAVAAPAANHQPAPNASVPAVQNVKVVNASTEAVPTVAQGTTSVAGTVSAAQSGPWSVDITGTPTVNVGTLPNVTVANLPATQTVSGTVSIASLPPVQVANAATSPVPTRSMNYATAFRTAMTFEKASFQTDVPDFSPPIPTGKRLVIEHLSVLTYISSGIKPQLLLYLDSTFARLAPLLTLQASLSNFSPPDVWVAELDLHSWTDGFPSGGAEFFTSQPFSAQESAITSVTFSGYLIDKP